MPNNAYSGGMREGGEKMNDCKEHGDVYLFCEGVRYDRANGETICSAHWGVYVLKLALGMA